MEPTLIRSLTYFQVGLDQQRSDQNMAFQMSQASDIVIKASDIVMNRRPFSKALKDSKVKVGLDLRQLMSLTMATRQVAVATVGGRVLAPLTRVHQGHMVQGGCCRA